MFNNKILNLIIMIMLAFGIFAAGPQLLRQEIKENYETVLSINQYNLLIAESMNNQTLEINKNGSVLWQKTGLQYPVDVERLSNGNTLITEFDANAQRVIEVNKVGKIVWQKDKLNQPIDAERLSNGNTIIAEYFGGVTEYASNGSIVWQKNNIQLCFDVERLSNGNTLIVDLSSGKVLEVDNSGTIIWQKTGLSEPTDAERLGNGNTLIAESKTKRVIELNSTGGIVWQKNVPGVPMDVERLSNGNTLIAYNHRDGNYSIVEVITNGTVIWQKTSTTGYIDIEVLPASDQSSDIKAAIDFDPETLNKKSNGNWVTVYIELSGSYNVSNINASTVLLNNKISPVLDPKYGFVKNEDGYIMDHDGDNISERMLKFDRKAVQDQLPTGCNITITITGKLFDGTTFEGTDSIRVINPPDEKSGNECKDNKDDDDDNDDEDEDEDDDDNYDKDEK